MNLRIAVIETEHFEVLDPVIHLLLQIGAEIHVLCSRQVNKFSEFKLDSRLNWHFNQSEISPRQQLLQFEQVIASLNVDRILLLTVSNNHFFYRRLKKNGIKVVLGIHDINSYLIPQIKFSLRGLVRHFSKKILFNSADEYLVFSNKQALTLQAETKKNVHHIPPALFHSVQFLPRSYSKGQELLVVIPGSIDIKRRNYEEVFAFIEEAENLHLNARVVILGAPPVDQLETFRARVNSIRSTQNGRIDFFEEQVPTDVFFEYLRKAHFIWSPVQKVFDNDGESWETYGVTKISGSVYDAIRVGRPLILPDHYVVDPPLLKAGIFYRSVTDICSILQFVASHPEQYAVYQLQALNASMDYVPEKWVASIENIFKT